MGLPPDIQAALNKLEPAMRAAFMESIARVSSAAQLQAIIGYLEAGNVQAAAAALQLDTTFFAPLDRAISESYWQGGVLAVASIPAIRDPFSGAKVVFGFDARHPRAEAWVREKAGTLIEGIQADTLQGVRDFMEAGVRDGRGPRAVALDIVGRINPVSGRREGGIIGLNSQQTDYMINARRELLSGNPSDLKNYLRRERRDRRFDPMVMRAIEDGKPLSAKDTEKLLGRYQDRLLQLRAETIARTEAITALRAGKHEGYTQLLDSGAVSDDQIERRWSTSSDARVRDDHAAMNGDVVFGMNSLFTAPDGSKLAYPGDTSNGASASQTINCRCIETVRIEYIP